MNMKRSFVLASFLVAVFLFIPSFASAYALGPGEYNRKIPFGGLERSFVVRVPRSYSPNNPTAVILNLHGGGGNAQSQKTISLMDSASEKYGFIVVYPEGTGPKFTLINPNGYTWNAGTCCGWAENHKIDDVGFINAMLNDLEKQFNVDKKRVFSTGISNGAIMSYRLACELSNRIAAIGPVSGTMGVTNCLPPRPVSVIHFHGTDDKFEPFAGGRGPRSTPGENFMPVQKDIDFWLRHNGISGQARIIKQGDSTGYYYGPGSGGAEVALWVIQGGGHTWPGGAFGVLGQSFLGKMTHDISADDLMWEFFQMHPLP
jgi:polyhydroxybutyrate depolymerase